MSKRKKVLLSALVAGMVATFVGLGVFGLFSATTQNSGNEISSGTVVLSDNDSGSSLFNVTGASPGDTWTRCIKVSYHGSLPADVHLYMTNTSGPLADYVNLEITQGSQAAATFPDCTGFTPDATGTIYSGLVHTPGAPVTPGSWEFGLPITPAGETNWAPESTLVFQFTATLDPATPDTMQNSSIGTSTVVWEARTAA